MAAVVIGKRYLLEEQLGVGGMGAVYRAIDRLSGQPVALKRVTTPTEHLAFMSRTDSGDTMLALAHEFQMLASLRHPHIISVLDYGFDDEKHPYFTMDLLENPETLIEWGQRQPTSIKINLLVQMLQALAYLHRRGIIHRDLKPSNVLVIPEANTGREQVKVLDFGLSVIGVQASGTVGTLTYMAPEVIQGEPAGIQADLYAVGVMGYELFTGRYPYDATDLNRLVTQIVKMTVDVWLPEIQPKIADVLERLLLKEPLARYASASDVLADLSKAVDQPFLLETAATRESFLQAARLVGRDAEITALTIVLDKAIAGQGSAWLIGGESGVGKSRLLDELRTLAMVRGAVVLRGQEVSEGGSPYELWRNALRRLILMIELDDLEASMLKMLVPQISSLIGRDVPDPPRLEPQEVQTRLATIIKDVFQRQQQPIVVILEDLHWARHESLAVLVRLIGVAQTLPLLLIGSYRDDEAPDLAQRLSGMQSLRLNRLTAESIAELSETILGAAGRRAEVVELLQRETEGNVFFLVEVVRALAEEAGQLDNIASMTLPENVFAGGVQQIVQRRLSRVAEQYRPFLEVAAVAGRQLDLDLLRTVDKTIDLETCLNECANAAVLDVQEGDWRFTHEKLREALVAGLDSSKRPKLHRQIAEAIEMTHPDTEEQTSALAYHWAQAGDEAKEAIYAAQAGEQALRSGAYREAMTYIERALTLNGELYPPDYQFDDNPETIFVFWLRQASLQRRLAEVYLGTGGYIEAQYLFTEGLTISRRINDDRGIADCCGNLGSVAEVLGNYEQAKDFYEESLELYRKIGDRSGIMRALNSLGNVAYDLGEDEEARQLYQESLALSREIGDQWGMAGSLSEHTDTNADSRQLYANLRAAFEGESAANALTVLVEIAETLMEAGDKEKALELFALALHHAEAEESTIDRAERHLFELENEVSPDAMAALWEAGKTKSLDDAVRELLHSAG
ncbi:MAG: AAA family ATPase [Burkholderiales bacterium]|nr:AAA family ATPase [Anaerolineae bacterium]